MLEVVAGDEDGGASLLVVVYEQALEGVLATWVEEVERLVEDEELRLIDKSRDDTYLLLVACAKVAYQLLLIHYFASHEGFYIFQTVGKSVLVDIVDLGNKLEIFFGREEVDEETLVDISARDGFPILVFCWVDAVERYVALVGLYQVEQEAE